MKPLFVKGDIVQLAIGCLRGFVDMPDGNMPIGTPSVRGIVLGEPVFCEQWWIPVLWEDEDDPGFFKSSCLVRCYRRLSKKFLKSKKLVDKS